MQEGMVKRASELLADGTVVRVLGWKTGNLLMTRHRLFLNQQKH